MKKYFLILVIVLLSAVCVFATGGVKKQNTDTLSETQRTVDVYEQDTEKANVISSIIQDMDDFEYMSYIDKLITAFGATMSNNIDYNDALYNFEYLRRAYNLSDDDISYLSDLIIKGYDPWDVIDICYFWVDTSEDIRIIEEIYQQKHLFRGNTWIENAFNYVTDNKCGVLDSDDINNYLNQGASAEDIMLANKICRKGIYTIQKILEMHIEGKSFADILLSTEAASSSVSVNKTKLLNNEITEHEEYASLSAESIEAAETLVRINGGKLEEYYKKAENNEDLTKLLEEDEDNLNEEINAFMRNNNYYKEISEQDMSEITAREVSADA